MLIQAPPQILLNQLQPTPDEFLILENGTPPQFVQLGSVVYNQLPNGTLFQVLSPLVIQPSPQTISTGGQLQFQARPQFQAIPSPQSDGTFAVGGNSNNDVRPDSSLSDPWLSDILDEYLETDYAVGDVDRETVVKAWQKKQ